MREYSGASINGISIHSNRILFGFLINLWDLGWHSSNSPCHKNSSHKSTQFFLHGLFFIIWRHSESNHKTETILYFNVIIVYLSLRNSTPNCSNWKTTRSTEATHKIKKFKINNRHCFMYRVLFFHKNRDGHSREKIKN